MTDTMKTVDIEKLKELEAKATPLPWPNPDDDEDFTGTPEEMEHNRRFVWELCNTFPAIISELTQLRTELAAARERERVMREALTAWITPPVWCFALPKYDAPRNGCDCRSCVLTRATMAALSATGAVEGCVGDSLTIDLNDPNVQWILALMCFQCGPIAHVLQRNGHEIEKKAEAEQPYVMTWLLKKYHELGKCEDWREKVDAELNAMERARKETLDAARKREGEV